jgi:hypothetical protein
VFSVNRLRGFFLLAVAIAFGVQAMQLKIGTPGKAGPGLFPLIVSCALGLAALGMLIETWSQTAEPHEFNLKNIGLIAIAMIGFTIIAHWSVIPAIVFLVFVSSLAGTDFTVMRSVKISVALIAIAAAFRFGLGVNLRWWW